MKNRKAPLSALPTDNEAPPFKGNNTLLQQINQYFFLIALSRIATGGLLIVSLLLTIACLWRASR